MRSVGAAGGEGVSRAVAALRAAGIAYRIVEHEQVGSAAEAAAARGVAESALIKTLVVRRGAGDHLFVLVGSDREIAWPKLRALLGVGRISMPDAASAREVTGYERGTITPFGSLTALPVIADAALIGQVAIGAGGHGVAAIVDADELIAALGAERADVTEPRG
ncbi:aminoacyl-tRNA deacylase [Naumannella huperziae]